MIVWTNGWLWIIAGLVLALAELILPGWVLMGSALAVAAMGVMLLTGLWAAGLPAALVVTAVLSGLFWLALSRMAGVDRGSVRVWHRDINDNDR